MNPPDNRPHRRSLRLQNYDYSQAGAYFITICTQGRQCLFGDIRNDRMMLNEYGCFVRDEWLKTAKIRAEIQTGEFVVMPNHFHGIVIIAETIVGAIDERAIDRTTSHLTRLSKNNSQVIGYRELPLHQNDNSVGAIHESPLPLRQQRRQMALPKIIGRFKMLTAKRINEFCLSPGVSVWQRNYYEHVIRDEDDYRKIAEYIADNPRRWAEDVLHPNAGGAGNS